MTKEIDDKIAHAQAERVDRLRSVKEERNKARKDLIGFIMEQARQNQQSVELYVKEDDYNTMTLKVTASQLDYWPDEVKSVDRAEPPAEWYEPPEKPLDNW